MKILHAVFLTGAFAALYSVFRPYAVLEGGSTGIAVLLLCICSGGVLFSADEDEHVSSKYIMCSLFPWLLASLLITNGIADHSHEVLHHTFVIESRYYLRGIDIVNVQPWRSDRGKQSLYLKRSQLFGAGAFFLPGDAVAIGVRSGALGIPWISSISDRAGRDRLH
jgi:hypothetical protein